MTRGAADSKTNDKVRTKKYFKSYDTNEIVDKELKNKR